MKINKIDFDFTINTYKALLNTLLNQGFSFISIKEMTPNPTNKVAFLRHDVDALSLNSLKFAKIQAEKGITGTYYFRIVQQSFNEKIIKEIYSLGHEVGYHYEDFAFAMQKAKGKKQREAGHKEFTLRENLAKIQVEEVARVKCQKKDSQEDYERYLAEIAIESFKDNLEKLRMIVPVKTICMHGSPMSRWDSRLLWKYYDYHDFGIIGEPYFDVNFDKVFYLTDTGRCWDGGSFNIRDKAAGSGQKAIVKEKNSAPSTLHHAPFPGYHSTFDIIKACEENRLPDKIMMTFHPQRWTNKPIPWVKELVWQNVKNVGKYFLIRIRD